MCKQSHNVRTLTLNDATEIPLLEMIDLLRTSENRQLLFIPMVNSSALAEAIQVNQSLERLSLRFDPDAWPTPTLPYQASGFEYLSEP
jgi:hypothetical protein